jgi:two-component system, NarL family, invasion response regulator UvrY
MEKTSVGLVDDHRMIRKGLANLVESFDNYTVVLEADDGLDMQVKLDPQNLPDIILLDISMPGMDGYGASQWLKENYPSINIIILSMISDEKTIIRMIKLGVRGYILKYAAPEEFKEALDEVRDKGFYYSDFVTGTVFNSVKRAEEKKDQFKAIPHLSAKEVEFLQYICSELSYKEIADKMCVSTRTIDRYRDMLFEKLNLKTRVGLAMFGVKHGIVEL